jgi:hypothetical protein
MITSFDRGNVKFRHLNPVEHSELHTTYEYITSLLQGPNAYCFDAK